MTDPGLIDFIVAVSVGLGLAAASGFRIFLTPMLLSGGLLYAIRSIGRLKASKKTAVVV
jgi:hypothetical protein